MDKAEFRLDSAYSVSFPANATNYQALIDDGDVTFNLQGRTYSVLPHFQVQDFDGLLVGQSFGSVASLTIGNGTVRVLEAEVGTVPSHSNPGGGVGTLNIVGGGVFRAQDSVPSARVAIGYNSTGTMNLTGGGKAFLDNLTIATGLSLGSSSLGRVNVSGAGSSITINQELNLASHWGGDAALTVSGGGQIVGHLMYVGRAEHSSGRVVIEGAGSVVRSTTYNVALGGHGEVEVRDGGTLAQVNSFITGRLNVGPFNGGEGLLTVTGAGSTVSTQADLAIAVTNPLNPGDQSTGTFRVVGGGPTITIGGKLLMGVSDPRLSAVIDGTGLAPIQVASTASLRGQMVVDLKNATPALGRRYTVLTAAGGVSGSLQLAGPDAASFSLETGPNALTLVYTARPGDATGDGSVDFADLVVLAQNYDRPGGRSDGDLNHDDRVSFEDFVVLAQNYGGGVGAARAAELGLISASEIDRAFSQVPEPAAGGLLFGIARITLSRRRRAQ